MVGKIWVSLGVRKGKESNKTVVVKSDWNEERKMKSGEGV